MLSPFINRMVTALMLFVLCSTIQAHPGLNDPALHELNDYLMAIQLLRADDTAAAELFDQWLDLREASWEIRVLTDERDLTMADQEVMLQIARTRSKQRQLLESCRVYFAQLMEQGPALHFVMDGKSVGISSPARMAVPVNGRKVMPVEIQNLQDSAIHVQVNMDANDAVLFWNSAIRIAAHSVRYVFIVGAPLQEQEYQSSLRIMDYRGHFGYGEVTIEGIKKQASPMLLRSDQPTRVALPEADYSPMQKSWPDSVIRITVRDADTQKPLPARITVTDQEGNHFWSPLRGSALAIEAETGGWATSLWSAQSGPYFYVQGEAILGVPPVGKTITVHHGFEYLPVSMQVPANGKVTVDLQRWVDMPSQGWYAGQTHIHTTEVGVPVLIDHQWPLVSQGEDLHVSAILTLKGEWETHAIYADEYPMGLQAGFSTDQHLLVYGEEYRHNPYGHLAFLGLDELIQPISSGGLGELGGPDYPSNSQILDVALDQGATTIAAHFGNFIRYEDPIKTPWPSTGYEMPVDVALGKIQLAEIAGNGGSLEVWYDILNCGFKIPASAGPDWSIKDTPRVYVSLGEENFTFENWCDGLRAGRSFITDGIMLEFSVNDSQPGSILHFDKGPAELRIDARAMMPQGNEPYEIIVNGEMVKRSANASEVIRMDDSGWIAIRSGQAHSNPVYVEFAGRPAGSAAPAKHFIEVITRLQDWVARKALFDNEQQKTTVLAELEKGKAVYREIINRAKVLGRE